ncbi:phosphomannomutase [Halolamina sp. CBA1230]|uniref:phosphomannomutase n=1 Tax=Halolamina sp. CBA1230 TaxID=1853690 RepID=UPI0009A1BE19|nr:phosphomannomutase [Halolamina sp. CBA1230]QKY19317.1 phosphomannomutase [Halolamina sp. CBA1230]
MELFGTAGIRGDVRETVTPSLALRVGQAAAADARAEGEGSVEFVVARDGRETGQALVDAMASGLAAAGADVVEIGQAPTPALAYASQGRYGVAITASHNPPEDNGIKLFVDGVEYSGAAEARIEGRIVDETEPTHWDEWGHRESAEVLGEYRDAVVAYAERFGADLDGLRVVVDCGNGMASLATPHVLRELGAEVVTLNGNVDGHFPGRGSKPTEGTLGDCIRFLEDGEFDLGIAHDGDADRIVVLNGDGEVVHEDTVLAMLAEEYVADADSEDPTVVTTPNASARIDERVRAAGGRVERVALGYLHDGIADARDDGADVAFAAEPWKHVHTRLGGWIDGVASAAVLARLVADVPLVERREPIPERPYTKVSVPCNDDAKVDAMARLAETLPERFPEAEVDDEYGVRLELPDASWVLVRPSGTEPYLRIYAESEDVETLSEAARTVVEDAISEAE